MQSFSKPTNEQAEAVVPLLSSPPHERYFFDRLNNPYWIEPLKQRGFFRHPPPAEKVEAGIRYTPWAASKYLARMASHAPKEVAEIFAEMETDNASVVGDMLDAALAMPADTAATLVPALCKVIDCGSLWLDFTDASDLCARLASERQADAAMRLADCLFTPTFAPNDDKPRRPDEHWYKEGLKKVMPALVSVRARELLPALCNWLQAAVEAKKGVHYETESDYSYVWRPAIEEHEQNRTFDFAGELVGFVRQAFEQAVNDDHVTLDVALSLLDQYPYLVFKRLRIHLITVFADRAPELARKTMMEGSLFDDYRFQHEYAMLVGRRFSMLQPDERNAWFARIETGPDMADFDETTKARAGQPATEADRRAYIRHWQFERLHTVRNYLETKWQGFYQQTLAEKGEPELADFCVRTHPIRWGHESPLHIDELKTLPFRDAVDKVASWRPDESSYFGPSVEGLASTFGQYVNSNPEDFSKQASAMKGKPAPYVRAFIEQMTEAVKAGKEIDVLAVLAVCDWVVNQPVHQRTSPVQRREAHVDNDWQWTRDTISRFLKAVCDAKVDNRPRHDLATLREAMWTILDPLTRDPAKSYIVSDPAKEDVRLRDLLTLGINSPRGKAVEAAVSYARWVAEHVKQTKDGQEAVLGGFDAMPEVRAMLEWQIAPENRSFEALSLIGAYIHAIYWIDKAWLAIQADRIFDLRRLEEDPAKAYGWAAWNAFLVWGQPHIEFYRLFRSQFAYAVEQASQVKPLREVEERPMNRLGEHLILLYGRGQLGLDDDSGLLRRFLSHAALEIRLHSVEFVGWTLEGDKMVPEEVIDRFMALWDWFWLNVGKQDAAGRAQGGVFGSWFLCGKFPEEWCLERLEEFAQVVPLPEPHDLIIEQLATVAETNASRAIRILDRMLRADKEGWRTYGWREAAKVIIERAMNAGGPGREQARQLIDHLGRRGYVELKELLKH